MYLIINHPGYNSNRIFIEDSKNFNQSGALDLVQNYDTLIFDMINYLQLTENGLWIPITKGEFYVSY
jgi:hypothetical protein